MGQRALEPPPAATSWRHEGRLAARVSPSSSSEPRMPPRSVVMALERLVEASRLASREHDCVDRAGEAQHGFEELQARADDDYNSGADQELVESETSAVLEIVGAGARGPPQGRAAPPYVKLYATRRYGAVCTACYGMQSM